jgi:Zn-dependent peptidase ImmA (M78 family)
MPTVQAPARGWHSEAARSLCAEYGTEDPARAILAAAALLVAESGLKRPAQNLDLLASLQDILGIERIVMSDAGRLLPTPRGLVVQVNAGDTAGRQNFSACHEISHTLVPSYCAAPGARVDATTGMYGEDREEEFFCDLGASELLMPSAEFGDALAARGLTVAAISPLAEEFGASLEAAAIKCIRVAAAPAGVIVWEPKLKPTQIRDVSAPCLFGPDEIPGPPEKLRIKFACCGAGLKGHFFPRDKSIDDESLIQRSYNEGWVVCGEQELPTGRGPAAFYTESQAFDFRRGEGWERKVITLFFPAGGAAAG